MRTPASWTRSSTRGPPTCAPAAALQSHQPSAGRPAGDPTPGSTAELPAWLATWFRQDLSGTTRRHIAVAWQLRTFTSAQVAAATGTDRERAWRSIELLRRRRLLTLRRQGNVQVYTWRRTGA
jgi:hypothetical protein